MTGFASSYKYGHSQLVGTCLKFQIKILEDS